LARDYANILFTINTNGRILVSAVIEEGKEESRVKRLDHLQVVPTSKAVRRRQRVASLVCGSLLAGPYLRCMGVGDLISHLKFN